MEMVLCFGPLEGMSGFRIRTELYWGWMMMIFDWTSFMDNALDKKKNSANGLALPRVEYIENVYREGRKMQLFQSFSPKAKSISRFFGTITKLVATQKR